MVFNSAIGRRSSALKAGVIVLGLAVAGVARGTAFAAISRVRLPAALSWIAIASTVVLADMAVMSQSPPAAPRASAAIRCGIEMRNVALPMRSEERRVGKEGRSRGAPDH